MTAVIYTNKSYHYILRLVPARAEVYTEPLVTLHEIGEIVGAAYWRWCVRPQPDSLLPYSIQNTILCDRVWTIPIDPVRVTPRQIQAAMELLTVQTRRVQRYLHLPDPVPTGGAAECVYVEAAGISLRLLRYFSFVQGDYKTHLDVCGWEPPDQRTDVAERRKEWKQWMMDSNMVASD